MRASRAVDWYKRRRGAVYRWAHILLPLSIIVAATCFRGRPGGWEEQLQFKVFDGYQRMRPRPYEAVPVRIIDIDEESLRRLGQWPWPRTRLAELVQKLTKAGASAIAFDMVFAEPDRTSPSRVVDSWPAGPGAAALREAARKLPDNDAVFARAIESGPVVLGMPFLDEDNGATPPAGKAHIAYGGESPLRFLTDFPGVARDLPALEEAASGIGVFSFSLDSDNIVRRPEILERHGNAMFPGLSIEALRVAQGQTTIGVKMAGGSGEKGGRTGLSRLKVGSYQFPVDPNGRFWTYFTPSVPERYVPAWRIFSGDFDGSKLKRNIVFVGTSAQGLRDIKATPLDPSTPGVEAHVNIAEQILNQRFLSRPDWAPGAELIFMVLTGLVLLALLPRLGAAWCALVAAAAVGGAIEFSWNLFLTRGYLIDPLYPSAVIVGVYMTSSLINYLKTEAEKRQVKGAFSRYMSPALVEQLAKHPERLKLGGETRNMTFHFCDIRGFTTISEQFDPHGLTQFINRFLTPMTEIILKHQGVIDKYMGDCIMAFWNAPLDDADHARHACTAALEMHARLASLNEELRAEAETAKRKFIPIHIGTGLNTGNCVVGNMGSDMRFDYSVLGDDVNLASRLEGQSKTYGVNVVLGPATREAAPEFAAIELDLIKVKGKTVPVHIYALMGPPETARSEAFLALAAAHAEMIAAYRAQKWERAKSLIARCREMGFPLKVLYDLYEHRIADYLAAPPAPDWDGAYTATSK